MTMQKLFVTSLLLLSLALPLASQSPEDGKDFWEEQRQYYRQYQAWELPSEAILEWLNQLEQSEKNLSKALTTFETLKVESEELQKQLGAQRNQLVLQSILTTAVAIGVTALLIVR